MGGASTGGVRTGESSDGDDQPESDALLVLGLVARSAPFWEYDRLVTQLERDGAPVHRVRRIERFRRVALSAHSMIEQRRSREAGLTALLDAAGKILAARHSADLFDVVVRRARLLLSVDVAYISLYGNPEPRGMVHGSDGAATALAVGLRVPAGMGLGGMVMRHRASFWSSDYLDDDSFDHDDTLDHVIRAEGVHAMLAVPMRTERTDLGVLYVGARQVRHFAPDEVTLLTSLGELAAAGVERVRQQEELREETAETPAADSDAGATSSSDQHDHLQERLIDLVLDDRSVDELLSLAGREMGGGAGLRGPAGEPLAAYGTTDRLLDEDVRAACRESADTEEPSRVDAGAWVVPLRITGHTVGFLVADVELAAEPDMPPVCTAVARALAVHLRMQRGQSVDDVGRQEFFDDLTGAARSPKRLRERAVKFSLNFSGPHVLLVARGPEHLTAPLEKSTITYAEQSGGLCSMRDDHAVLLIPGADPTETGQHAARQLTAQLEHPITVGVGGPAESVEAISGAYREASRCLEALCSLDGVGGIASVDDLGFLGMLLSEDNDIPGYIEQTIGPVVDYDAQRFTVLVPTLQAYFDSGKSPIRAAEALYVHPNTVSRRLERITQLLGEDWRNPERALEIQLALRLRQISSVTAGRGVRPPSEG